MDTVLSRVLDHLGLPNELARRWGHDVSLQDAAGEYVTESLEEEES
jgi:hypothetical protein